MHVIKTARFDWSAVFLAGVVDCQPCLLSNFHKIFHESNLHKFLVPDSWACVTSITSDGQRHQVLHCFILPTSLSRCYAWNH